MPRQTGFLNYSSVATAALLLTATAIFGFFDYKHLMTDDPAHIVSAQIAAPGQTSDRIMNTLRDRFGLSNEKVTTTPIRSSVFPAFREMTFSFGTPPAVKSQRLYITSDGRYAIQGQIFDLNLRSSAKNSISTNDRPQVGPAGAPVEIVEFYDYQCPSCAAMEDVIHNQLLPKYKSNIRVVYKNFPNSPDDWGMQAALASECVFRLKPAAWSGFRSAVFDRAKQHAFTRQNARELLTGIGLDAGVGKSELGVCLSGEKPLSAVTRDSREGQAINVAGTPTFFVNGRVLAGEIPEEAFAKAIDSELAAEDCHCIH